MYKFQIKKHRIKEFSFSIPSRIHWGGHGNLYFFTSNFVRKVCEKADIKNDFFKL